MKEIVLITGGNGLIAQHLAKMLTDTYSVRLLTRKKRQDYEYEWNINEGFIDEQALHSVDHIIHLAGASIAGKRWTKDRKKEILSSRIDSAELLLVKLKLNNIKVKTFISASAVGYYGAVTSDRIYTEEDNKGSDFLSGVVDKWERVADKFKLSGTAQRVVKIRTGVVLSADAMALKMMKLPVQLYMGAPLGSGNQFMPWIHIYDICSIYRYALNDTKMSGVYNAVSPESVTNKEFTKVLASVLKRPLLLPAIPGFMIRLLFDEAAMVILEGSRVSAEKIMDEGYHFKYNDLKSALKNIFQ